MSKARKHASGKTKRRSPALIGSTWLASLLSLPLLLFTANIFMSDMASFRSCSANDSGLTLTSCGKQSLNLNDLLLLLLLVLAASLTVSLFTAAWRFSRGGRE